VLAAGLSQGGLAAKRKLLNRFQAALRKQMPLQGQFPSLGRGIWQRWSSPSDTDQDVYRFSCEGSTPVAAQRRRGL